MTYDEARVRMADWLEKNATGYPGDPRDGYDEMDGALPRGVGPEWAKVFIALSFWDGWVDASNHEWRYYDPIGKNDWPDLAHFIVSEAGPHDFGGQISDAIEFLNANSEELGKVVSSGSLGATLDFAVAWRDVAVQNDVLPAELIRRAAEFGSGIELSHYPIAEDENAAEA